MTAQLHGRQINNRHALFSPSTVHPLDKAPGWPGRRGKRREIFGPARRMEPSPEWKNQPSFSAEEKTSQAVDIFHNFIIYTLSFHLLYMRGHSSPTPYSAVMLSQHRKQCTEMPFVVPLA